MEPERSHEGAKSWSAQRTPLVEERVRTSEMVRMLSKARPYSGGLVGQMNRLVVHQLARYQPKGRSSPMEKRFALAEDKGTKV